MDSQMLQMLPPTQLTMALSKFSSATTSQGYPGPIPWTHIIRETGLFAIFEFPASQSVSQGSESTRFKIVNEPEILVECVRRFQIRLAQKDQFYEAVKIFSRANVPTTDAGHDNGQQSLGSQNSISQIAHRTAPQTVLSASRVAPTPFGDVHPNFSGQALAPTVSHFASQSRAPDKRPTSSILQQQGVLPGSRRYRNAATEAGRWNTQPQTSLVTYNRAADQTSSAPVPGGVQGSGYINLHDPRPLTAPILVPRSPVTDIPPQRELPFGPKLRSANGGPSPSPAVPATSNSLAKLNEAENQESRTQVQNVFQTTEPESTSARPAPSSIKAVVDVKKTLSAGPIRAEDIDTQQLLEKVATRRSNSRKKQQNPRKGAKRPSIAQFHTSTASQKRRKNPCLDAGRDCSFAADAGDIVSDEAVTLVKPELQMQNPQDTALKVLRSREIQPVDATAAPVSQEIPVQEIKQTKGVDANLPVKRSSQLAMPAPKQLKAKKDEIKSNPQTAGRNTRSKKQDQSNTSFQPSNPQHAVKGLSNSPTHLRSDATTATVDTFDLDPAEKHQKTTRKVSPPRPLYSELSATTDHSGPADHDNRPPHPPQPPEAIADLASTPKTTTGSSTSTFAQPLAELMNLSPNDQNVWLDQAFVEALQDDSFVPFCEMINSRWEQHLFNFKQ
ncbi:hypothetical protein LTR70_007551 [Exophiala xenobiotica]|uniref:Uncharacterized protein n=1 Tax=Lithohypha guttulata TaxID=1690604 RepID=A0ABR0K986_9EURO|nr:hypothetical protein LTR24_005982 [Lithohypha guttulata]KAK5313567.1 hypothetical protein LTR70_007551 [Exophiala xenobiotica]